MRGFGPFLERVLTGGVSGTLCERCKQPIFSRNGQQISMNPNKDIDNNPAAPAAAAAEVPKPPSEEVEVEALRTALGELREQMAVLVSNQLASMSGGLSPLDPTRPDAHLKAAEREKRAEWLRKHFGKGADGREMHALARRDIAAYRRLRDEARACKVYGR